MLLQIALFQWQSYSDVVGRRASHDVQEDEVGGAAQRVIDVGDVGGSLVGIPQEQARQSVLELDAL